MRAGLNNAMPWKIFCVLAPPANEDLLVPGKLGGALAATRKDATVRNRGVVEDAEISSRGRGIRVVKTSYSSADCEDLAVGEQVRAGRMEIQAALWCECVSG